MNSFVPSRSRRRFRLAVESMEPRWFLAASTLALDFDSSDVAVRQQAFSPSALVWSDSSTTPVAVEASFSLSDWMQLTANSDSFPLLNEVNLDSLTSSPREADVLVIDVGSYLNGDALVDYLERQSYQVVATSSSWNDSRQGSYYAFQRINPLPDDSPWIGLESKPEQPLPSFDTKLVDLPPATTPLDDLPDNDMMGSQGQSSLFQMGSLDDTRTEPMPMAGSATAANFSLTTTLTEANSRSISMESVNLDEGGKLDGAISTARPAASRPSGLDPAAGEFALVAQGHTVSSSSATLAFQATSATTSSSASSSSAAGPMPARDRGTPTTHRLARASANDSVHPLGATQDQIVGSWVQVGGLRIDAHASSMEFLDRQTAAAAELSAETSPFARVDSLLKDERATDRSDRESPWVWQQLIGSTTADRLTRALIVGTLLPILPRQRLESWRRRKIIG